MTNQHPITPPPKLVREWLGTYFGTTIAGEVSKLELALATQAARWGADQELEACVKWLEKRNSFTLAEAICNDRRPKPPSLKEQALAILSKDSWSDEEEEVIRLAVRALPND